MTTTTTSTNNTPSDSQLSPDHFRNILTNETQYLDGLCEKWSLVLESLTNDDETNDETNEEICGVIRSTIGQAKLLMSKRFKQFAQLIDDCQYETGQLPTRLSDLSGFWEMISFQVRDVHKKFDNIKQVHEQHIMKSE